MEDANVQNSDEEADDLKIFHETVSLHQDAPLNSYYPNNDIRQGTKAIDELPTHVH